MNRIRKQEQAEAIAFGLGFIPEEIRRLAGPVDFFVGDAAFAGLHRYRGVAGTYPDGSTWDYSECAHYVWDVHQRHRPKTERRPTIVVPESFFPFSRLRAADTVAHEFGHHLDEALGRAGTKLDVPPITRYARTNAGEAFAEAVSAWFVSSSVWARDGWRAWLRRYAPDFVGFVESLSPGLTTARS